MTKKEHNYIKKQLYIIQDKADEDALRRYEMLLDGAKHKAEVYDPLKRACQAKREELNPVCPMAVNGDIDDIN